MNIICHKCSASLPEGTKVCPFCGAEQLQIDSNSLLCTCGNVLRPSDRFCSVCGKTPSAIKAEKEAIAAANQNQASTAADQKLNVRNSRIRDIDDDSSSIRTQATQTTEQKSVSPEIPPKVENIQPQASNIPVAPLVQIPPQVVTPPVQPQPANQIQVAPPANTYTQQSTPQSNFQQPQKPIKKKSKVKIVFAVLGIVAFLTLTTVLAIKFWPKGIEKPEYTEVSYYPQEGAAGSYVYFTFDKGFDPSSQEVDFYYNSQKLTILSYAENVAMIQVPFGATDGKIEIRSDDEVISSHDFKILKPEFKELASETIRPSGNEQTFSFPNDIQVKIPAGFVSTNTGISVSEVKNSPCLAENPLSPVLEYEVIIEGMEQLPDYIEISFPYDKSVFGDQMPDESQILAFRRDKEFQHTTTLPYRFDKTEGRVYVYTNHLSIVGAIVIGGLIIGPAIGILGPEALDKLSYDVYITPQKNIRLLYSKELEKSSNYFNESDWTSRYKPNIAISNYDKNHPKFIQDIGEMFEIALENYRKAGLKEAVIKPGWIWGQTINHVNIKLDSYTAQISSEPSYLSHTGYIHLGAELYLTDFRGDETSCCYVGHELFHRVQAEYYNFTRFKRAQDFWWIEACAEYAADRVAWKNNINTWTGKQYWKMFKQIPNDLLSHPLNTTGKPNGKYQNEYEYHASVFIYYLVEVCGYDFAGLIDAVSQGAPLVKLDEFLRSKTGGSNGMAYHYSAFARWAFFTEGAYASGFFKNFPLADFSGTNTNELAEKKESIVMPANKEVNVSLTGSKDVSVEVYKIMNGTKLSGNQSPKSIAVLQDGQTAKITAIKPGEILFFMAVNNAGADASVTLKLFDKPANKPAEDLCEYTFSFKDSYSAKLFAVKPKDLELKINPDTISDGKLNEKYKFELKAENIPANVSSVYFEYDFDNIADKKARGKTAPISVDKDKNIESEIEYTWKNATKKSVVKVRMINAANNKELATAQAIVQFYTVKIQGDRNISYVIAAGSATEFKQKFVAEASPVGDYKFEWEFGDGSKSGKIAGKNQKSETEHIYKNLKPGQEFKPKVKLYDQNDNLLAEDEIYISVDDDSKPDNTPDNTPVTSNSYSLDFRIYMFVNYTEGYSDAQQSWTKSDYHGFETAWNLQIGKGSSFSGSDSFGGVTESWSGSYNNQMMTSFKYNLFRKWMSGSTMIREEWMTIELRNLPVEPDYTGEYGIRFGLDGWDCDKQKPNPDFEKSIVKIEHKFKFYPSGKEISIANLDFSKSEVYACNNWQNLWIPRAHLFVGISYNK